MRGHSVTHAVYEIRDECLTSVVSRTAEEWLQTNDRVEITNRRLKPLGRADDVVKVLGELVNTHQVKLNLTKILASSLPSDAFAVVAIPDERKGSRLACVFERQYKDILETAISHYNERAPGPTRIEVQFEVDHIPKTALGKIAKGELLKTLFP